MKDRAQALADLGNKVKAIREEKGLSLEDVAEVTKIRTNFLEAIEKGVYDNFPGSVYIRGFIKSYLHVLDADDLWPEFKPYLFSEDIVGTPDIVLGNCIPPTKGFRQTSRLWMIIVLLMIIAGFGWYGFSVWTSPDKQLADLGDVAPVENNEMATVAEKISEPSIEQVDKPVLEEISKDEENTLQPVHDTFTNASVAAAGVSSSSDVHMTSEKTAVPVSADRGEMKFSPPVLTISAGRDCWVKLSDQEKTIFQGIIKADTEKEFRITGRTEAVYGRPGSLEISFGEKRLGKPGEAGTVARWYYSPDGNMGRISE